MVEAWPSGPDRRQRAWLWGPVLVWALLMLWGCLNESDPGASAGRWRQWLPWLAQLTWLDKLAHFGLHAVLAALVWRALVASQRTMNSAKGWAGIGAAHQGLAPAQAWMVVLGCALFGLLIEAMQWGLTQTRSAEWGDALANTLGAGVAVGLLSLRRALPRRSFLHQF